MRIRVTCAVSAAVLATVVTACGSSGSSPSSSNNGSSTPGSSGGSSFTLKQPLVIVGLWEIKGESSNGTNELQDAAEVAIQQINAAGGVGGHPVVYKRVATSVTNPTATIAAVRKALDLHPSILVGAAGSDAAVAAAPVADQAGVPLLALGQDDDLLLGGRAGNAHTFEMVPSPAAQEAIAAQVAVQQLGAKRVGIMYVNLPYGSSAVPNLKSGITKAGGTVTAVRNYAFDATDLTSQVLAMKGSDAVIDWAYPNPLGIQLNEFVENGLDIPTVDAASAAITVEAGLAKGKAIAKLYGTTYCNPVGDTNPATVAFNAKYKAIAGTAADAIAANGYDAINVAIAAAKKAQSSSPDAITTALDSLDFTGGVCASTYQTDSKHLMDHSITSLSFTGGVAKTIKVYSTPPE